MFVSKDFASAHKRSMPNRSFPCDEKCGTTLAFKFKPNSFLIGSTEPFLLKDHKLVSSRSIHNSTHALFTVTLHKTKSNRK